MPVPRARQNTFPPGTALVIFYGKYYSRTEVQAEQPRPALAAARSATAEELRAVWGPFVGEAGTLESSGDSLITMRATVAKNPAAMSNGAFSVYSYERNGNTPVLTPVRSATGPPPGTVDCRDVRMVERCEGLRLTLESRNTFAVARERCRQHFDGDLAVQRPIDGLPDLTHSALADLGRRA